TSILLQPCHRCDQPCCCSLRSCLFPYTTLFRSVDPRELIEQMLAEDRGVQDVRVDAEDEVLVFGEAPGGRGEADRFDEPRAQERSEEHTSELQSRFDLVCRLLLEKKNTYPQIGR